jgi:hypothetical protein
LKAAAMAVIHGKLSVKILNSFDSDFNEITPFARSFSMATTKNMCYEEGWIKTHFLPFHNIHKAYWTK